MQEKVKDDTVSRQAAIDALFELYEYQRDIDPTEAADLVRQGIYLAEKKIEQLPSVQPTIIRCAECKWFQCNMRMDGYLPKGVDEFECRHWCDPCDPVDFCSHAERIGEAE